jgi:hypothetical protein
MARKRYTAEQIINHLREAEILISQGKSVREADLPPVLVPHPELGCG